MEDLRINEWGTVLTGKYAGWKMRIEEGSMTSDTDRAYFLYLENADRTDGFDEYYFKYEHLRGGLGNHGIDAVDWEPETDIES